ncbi:MAG: hypothetical protein SGI77_13300 [Pirellulaceae bacterium]|nr:hypothetical protein [Pirellulaceae bacterium]
MSKKNRKAVGELSAKKPALNATSRTKKPKAKLSPGDDSYQDVQRRFGQFTGKGETLLKLGKRRDED